MPLASTLPQKAAEISTVQPSSQPSPSPSKHLPFRPPPKTTEDATLPWIIWEPPPSRGTAALSRKSRSCETTTSATSESSSEIRYPPVPGATVRSLLVGLERAVKWSTNHLALYGFRSCFMMFIASRPPKKNGLEGEKTKCSTETRSTECREPSQASFEPKDCFPIQVVRRLVQEKHLGWSLRKRKTPNLKTSKTGERRIFMLIMLFCNQFCSDFGMVAGYKIWREPVVGVLLWAKDDEKGPL